MNGCHRCAQKVWRYRTRLTDQLADFLGFFCAHLCLNDSHLKRFVKNGLRIVAALLTFCSPRIFAMSQLLHQPSEGPQAHIPVLIAPVLAALRPADGEVYVDCTFGAGGYSRAILAHANCRVIGLDRDPSAIADGQGLVAQFGGRLTLVQTTFDEMESVLADCNIDKVDGVVMDIGVSSMQLDQAERGFSFMREGPLDMRMAQAGMSAADVVAVFSAEQLADVIYVLGEEPRSRAIARAIVKAREEAPILTTLDLVRAVERATGPHRQHLRTHPATRTFQALRIFVNDELGQLANALHAAEKILKENGRLVIVSFHSLEDRIAKQFLTQRSGNLPSGSRYLPAAHDGPQPTFKLLFKGHVGADDEELAVNPRSRSAKLRAAVRTNAPAQKQDPKFSADISSARFH
jgi:16S rRNA (cytosine1402-N4)-methyltransferase